jgi:iron complex outermembrane receptor protein
MSQPHLKYSVLALAVMQAVSNGASAQSAAQPMQEVVISGSKPVTAERASIGGFADAPLLQTPASITVIGRAQMQDFGIHNSTDAMKLDASVSDSYNAVGYAEQFSIRGFALDNASSGIWVSPGIAMPSLR